MNLNLCRQSRGFMDWSEYQPPQYPADWALIPVSPYYDYPKNRESMFQVNFPAAWQGALDRGYSPAPLFAPQNSLSGSYRLPPSGQYTPVAPTITVEVDSQGKVTSYDDGSGQQPTSQDIELAQDAMNPDTTSQVPNLTVTGFVLTRPMPSITATAPPSPPFSCSAQEWANRNPVLAAAVVVGVLLLLKRK